LTAHPLDRLSILFFVGVEQPVRAIVDSEAFGDPFQLLSPGVGRRQMTLHVPEQRRHLTEDVVGRREVEQLSLRGVEVASRALDKRATAKNTVALARVELPGQGGIPGRFEVALDRLHQDPIAVVTFLRRDPVTQRVEFGCPRQGALAPGDRHRASDRIDYWLMPPRHYGLAAIIGSETAVGRIVCDCGPELAH